MVRLANWVFATVVLLSATGAAWALDSSNALPRPGVRIVGCDEAVKSRKRGLCANHLSLADFRALAPGISWFYDWHYQPEIEPPAGSGIEFIPMVWAGDNQRLEGAARYLAGHRARALLAINEPNLRGQAFITPKETAAAGDQIKTLAERYGLPVVGPNMALGSAKPDSITAYDPLENATATYTFMLPFLKAVIYYAHKNDFSALAFHGYGNSGELHWATNLLHSEFGKPVWVTEFAYWHAEGDAAELAYMMDSVDFLERTPFVQGYAWFKERVDGNPMLSILGDNPGELTPLGKAYLAMPIHDANLYYRIPGSLEAGRYVRMENAAIAPADEDGGLTQMRSEKAGGWLEFNLDAPASGDYRLKLRLRGQAGSVMLGEDGRTLASVKIAGGGWETAQAVMPLKAGLQTLRMTFGHSSQHLHWIQFQQ